MGYKIKNGYDLKGLPGGKRDFRDSIETIQSQMFKNPHDLLLDALIAIVSFVYVPFRDLMLCYFVSAKSLRGKVCVVTGSGHGLGREICIALAKEGAIVACADINEKNICRTADILNQMGTQAKAYTLNLANKGGVEELARSVEADLGRVHVVVNSTEVVSPSEDEESIRNSFSVNTLGSIWIFGAFLPNMKVRNDGHIVNISSIGAAFGTPDFSVYCASKAAITNFSQAMREELSFQGYNNVHVTTVHPVMFNTPSTEFSRIYKLQSSDEDVVKTVIYSIKYNKGDVSTNPILFLLSSISKCMPLEVFKTLMRIR